MKIEPLATLHRFGCSLWLALWGQVKKNGPRLETLKRQPPRKTNASFNNQRECVR